MSEAEKYINEHINYRSNFKPNGYHEWITPDDALRACEIIKQETIKKAYEYISNYLGMALSCYPIDIDVLVKDKFVSKFVDSIREAMEE